MAYDLPLHSKLKILKMRPFHMKASVATFSLYTCTKLGTLRVGTSLRLE